MPWTTPAHVSGVLDVDDWNAQVDNLDWLHTGNALYLPSDPDGDLTGTPKAQAPLSGAILVPVVCRDTFTATRMSYRSDSASGKIDLGIYMDDGNGTTCSKISTTGLTLMPSGAGAKQLPFAQPAPLEALNKYWLVMGQAVTVPGSGGTIGAVMGTTGVLRLISRRAQKCMPLPTVITFEMTAPVDPDVAPTPILPTCVPCLAVFP